jgi:hypothetical protein
MVAEYDPMQEGIPWNGLPKLTYVLPFVLKSTPG